MRIPPLILLSVVLPALLGGCHKKKPAPSIDELSAALRRSAEQALPTPSLADDRLTLPAKPGQVEAAVNAVLTAAEATGGEALRTGSSQGAVTIFATVPEINADSFKTALRNNEKRTWEKPVSYSARLIDIIVKEAAAASPTP